MGIYMQETIGLFFQVAQCQKQGFQKIWAKTKKDEWTQKCDKQPKKYQKKLKKSQTT